MARPPGGACHLGGRARRRRRASACRAARGASSSPLRRPTPPAVALSASGARPRGRSRCRTRRGRCGGGGRRGGAGTEGRGSGCGVQHSPARRPPSPNRSACRAAAVARRRRARAPAFASPTSGGRRVRCPPPRSGSGRRPPLLQAQVGLPTPADSRHAPELAPGGGRTRPARRRPRRRGATVTPAGPPTTYVPPRFGDGQSAFPIGGWRRRPRLRGRAPRRRPAAARRAPTPAARAHRVYMYNNPGVWQGAGRRILARPPPPTRRPPPRGDRRSVTLQTATWTPPRASCAPSGPRRGCLGDACGRGPLREKRGRDAWAIAEARGGRGGGCTCHPPTRRRSG